MSAYSDWKAGYITDAEYAYICRCEEWEIVAPDEEDEEEVYEEDDIDEF